MDNNQDNNQIDINNINIDKIADKAKQHYDDFIIKYYSINRGLTRFASNTITQNIFSKNINISLTAYQDNKKITLSTNDITENGITQLFLRTSEMLKFSVVDLEYVPTCAASANDSDENDNRACDNLCDQQTLFDLSEENIKEAIRIKMAGEALANIKNYTISGTAESVIKTLAVVTKNGAKRFCKNSFAEYSNTIECNGERAADRVSSNKVSSIDYSQAFNRARNDVEMMIKKGKRSFNAGRYDVLLSSKATSELMNSLFNYDIDRRAYDEGHSPLTGKINSKIADSSITIFTDPGNLLLPSISFTSEGRPIKKNYFIKNGTLIDLPTSAFWAKKNNLSEWSMGNVIWEDNSFQGENGQCNHDERELLKNLKRGFYIKDFWYIRLVRKNDLTLTGMTRNGIFYVEDGEIVSASNHFRWNESAISILNRITAFSKGCERRSLNGRDNYFPAVLVKDFYLSSKTEF
ncbi:MAG: hypothetical protein HQK51_00920 [Oligoflexia bacterium]|nr:hypothetical protein [Oligoflexia bacterium]